jgi:hypothetical protein
MYVVVVGIVGRRTRSTTGRNSARLAEHRGSGVGRGLDQRPELPLDVRHTIYDDHIPFLNTLGIPAIDIIDFDFPNGTPRTTPPPWFRPESGRVLVTIVTRPNFCPTEVPLDQVAPDRKLIGQWARGPLVLRAGHGQEPRGKNRMELCQLRKTSPGAGALLEEELISGTWSWPPRWVGR